MEKVKQIDAHDRAKIVPLNDDNTTQMNNFTDNQADIEIRGDPFLSTIAPELIFDHKNKESNIGKERRERLFEALNNTTLI